MATWEGKTRGGVAGYRFFIFLLQTAGLKFSYFFLNFVVLYFVLFAPKARNPILYYFRTILNYNFLKSLRFTFKNFYKLGQVLLDKVTLLAGLYHSFTFDFEGEDHLHAMAAGEGGFLIGAHIGNWEIAGQLLDRVDTKVHILMVEAEHQRIKHLLDSVMTEKRMHIIAIKDDYSHLFEIREALQRNEIIALHGDRFMEGSKTLTGTLLGHTAEFPYGPFFLPVKYKKPVSFVSAIKESNTHYHFYATKPKLYKAARDKKSQEEKITEMLTDYTQEMESILRLAPEQWFNYYYFWTR
ncbi:MAG: lipid A biosynthesis acyltransferase [bacterium]|jgi:predicted LPLAT superfamily acyltransferase